MNRFFFYILFYGWSLTSYSQNIGINNTNPKSALDISGDIALRAVSLAVNGVNYDIDLNTVRSKTYYLTGATANFVIAGIKSANEGREVTLINTTGHSLELYNEEPLAVDSMRIITSTGTTLAVYNNGNVSLKYNSGIKRWMVLSAHHYNLNYYGAAATWNISGNSGTTPSDFIGTTDGQPLRFKVNNIKSGLIDSVSGNTTLGYGAFKNAIACDSNVVIGINALKSVTNNGKNNIAIGAGAMENNTIGEGHIAIGYQALKNYTNSSFPAGTYGANHNTAVGYKALKNNGGNGISNTGIGGFALSSNTIGYYNTAVGDFALWKNQNGFNNTAIGTNALALLTYSENNTALGSHALYEGGYRSTAIGSFALYFGSGSDNVAVGMQALNYGDGWGNTACGTFSLKNNSAGIQNTALGFNSMLLGSSGSFNVGIGYNSLKNNTGNYNIAIGYEPNLTNTTGSWNTVIGEHANTNANNLDGVTAIGASVLATTSNKIFLGANVAGMEVQAYGPYVNLSDGRFKENISENIPGLEFINKLRPVSYTFDLDKLQKHITSRMPDTISTHYYPDQINKQKAKQEVRTGFIAQEVETLLKTLNFDFDGLSRPDNETDTYSIAYGQFVVPLVKAVQEQQSIIESLKIKLDELEQKINNSNRKSK